VTDLERQVIWWPAQQGDNFDEFKSGEAYSNKLGFGQHLSICLKAEQKLVFMFKNIFYLEENTPYYHYKYQTLDKFCYLF
jgi:hypothetical protein